MNQRIFVRKKASFRLDEASIAHSLKEDLGLSINPPAIFQVYDVFYADEEELNYLQKQILCDPLVDEIVPESEIMDALQKKPHIGVTPLAGQYDPRADAAEQCLRLLAPNSDVKISTSVLYLFQEALSEDILATIRKQLINPVDACEKDYSELVEEEAGEIEPLDTLDEFLKLDQSDLVEFLSQYSLAMSLEDLELIQKYFQKEGRVPTMVELRVLDTYWSDHCRHTTFNTELTTIQNQSERYQDELNKILARYDELRKENSRDSKPKTLMELATLMGRDLRRRGLLDAQEVSDEINACSVRVNISTKSGKEPWLMMYKNETHNHPTEIEPFGGASTCLGGAIRDPLSGRAYVYQAMRISGAGKITTPVEKTLPNKLPQRVISRKACQGYSSYGNQIGLATTHVRELYHPGYVAKRLELGAVVAAVPQDALIREQPRPGDVIVLVGGRTGRDGIGGATGSSKAHTKDSLRRSGAEVQKGNPVCERTIQRLFKRPEVTTLIRKCNDFGAGGVSVAVGELADGIDIELDKVPLKYSGLNALEIAISESQERMAVLLDANDADKFIDYAHEENLEAVVIAKVNDEGRLRMTFRGETVLDLSREFLDTNGASRSQDVVIRDLADAAELFPKQELNRDELLCHLAHANHGSQEGMTEQFDASIGRSTVLMPMGGRYRKSEEQVSAQTFPAVGGSNTASVMSFGYQPALADVSPYLMGAYSVVEALSKLAAAGVDTREVTLSCQEFFQRLDQDEEAWGIVTSALLGLLEAQDAFSVAAIGGKDSMSGTFEDIHVPPTLVTFAIGTQEIEHVQGVTLPEEDCNLYYLPHKPLASGQPDYAALRDNFATYLEFVKNNQVVAGSSIRAGGILETLSKMALGNRVGLKVEAIPSDELASTALGGIVFASKEKLEAPNLQAISQASPDIAGMNFGQDLHFDFDEVENALESVYGNIYPVRKPEPATEDLPEFALKAYNATKKSTQVEKLSSSGIEENNSETKVRVLLPVFPGGNSEFDTEEAFRAAGAETEQLLIRNLDADMAGEDLEKFLTKVEKVDILVFSGGFSFGDEPDGSAKFIVNFLKSPRVKEAIKQLVERKGLVLGICNGFQALLKSGFLPYGDPDLQIEKSPTLFHNIQGRHISRVVRTCVSSTKSPWLSSFDLGEIHTLPISHGEGRLMINSEEAEKLFQAGQIAFQYVDDEGKPTLSAPWNPNGSQFAIEGMLSPCGHILGKMGHSERYRDGLMKNIPDIAVQDIFANAVSYIQSNKSNA